jgi:hypothetical protein
MVDAPSFIRTIKYVRELGYDANAIVSKVSNFEEFQIVEKDLKDSVAFLTKRKDNLKRDCQFFESQINIHSQTLAKYKELEDMGFGLKEQKLLWHKIREIGGANQMDADEAVRRFMKDVEEQYDAKLGFESKIQNTKLEIQNNLTKMQNMSSSLDAQTQNNIKMRQELISIIATQNELLSRVNEFSPLIQAAKGQVVAPNELIFALKKAIEITLARLEPSESLVEVLETTKLALGNTGDSSGSKNGRGECDIYPC